jgi:V8-like Glu-specific endopeptidase
MQLSPYAGVGRVTTVVQESVVGVGTCWLAGAATAITAAHVVELWCRGRSGLQVRLAGSGRPLEVAEVACHPDYGRAGGRYDPLDIAALRLPGRRRQGLPVRIGGLAQALVVHFPGTPAMLRSRGPALTPDGEVLIHQADTLPSSSGAPVFNAGRPNEVVALHVWGFGGNPYAATHPEHNLALQLTARLQAFIAAQVAAWG